MLIKAAEDHQADLDVLAGLLARRDVPSRTRARIAEEMRSISAGARAEHDAAYQIDFHLAGSRNWMVIHDLRLELGGRVAQIDHLILDRALELWVCESKSFADGVAINAHGEWARLAGNRAYGIASPIEQIKRHMLVLEDVFSARLVDLPRRLGRTLRPRLKSLVLVSASARIERPPAGSKVDGLASVIKVDQIRAAIDEQVLSGGPLDVPRIVSTATIERLARQLAELHRPIAVDWARRFGLPIDR